MRYKVGAEREQLRSTNERLQNEIQLLKDRIIVSSSSVW